MIVAGALQQFSVLTGVILDGRCIYDRNAHLSFARHPSERSVYRRNWAIDFPNVKFENRLTQFTGEAHVVDAWKPKPGVKPSRLPVVVQ